MRSSVLVDDEEGAGPRIADWRKARGLTQRQLAGRAHVSYSLLTKVERGYRPVSPSVLASVARVLHINPQELTGQPYCQRRDRVHAPIPAIRRALAVYDIAVEPDAAPRSLDQLARDTSRAASLRRATDYIHLGEDLPALLTETTHAAHTQPDEDSRERVFALLAEQYRCAHDIAYQLGYPDLLATTVDRYTWAAARVGDPLMETAGKWLRSAFLLGAGEYRAGLALLDRTRTTLSTGGRPTHAGLSVSGALHLRSAIIAARDLRADTAREHIIAADEIARRLGEADRDDYALSFGASNVAIHSVAVEVELGENGRALAQADQLRLPPTVEPERQSHHLIDTARAHLGHGDPTGALHRLQQARDIAPQRTRHHPMVREIVLSITRAQARRTDTVTGFAKWLGL